ncbi:dienelactone hydrolase family protein [Pseudoalteromonas sp. BDTF-M6]|uniref:dienelactone hydrolase family protein n=1 Tax=Pseudoalteromonas sp. BDTF-M6 TaxID=2796132 RepID=UPI001BAF5743|nr:dienelactone hydrolase family protein [Pseudoalteromonas sp. BDTF-M6]MBS3796189.1 dienelactone hydrolase family protein [Pseudoalteromonas sp. BDTF-M6]
MTESLPMQRIIVSDIFGRTRALERLAAELGNKVRIIDPYGGEPMAFTSEEQAYDHFMAHVGLASYRQLLSAHLGGLAMPTSLIGFSVGAAALWQLASHKRLDNITGMLLFYGGQIRHHLALTPSIPVTLVLPKSEPHFDINDLAQALFAKENVEIISTEFNHGFMNACSRHYAKEAYQSYVQALGDMGAQHCWSQLRLGSWNSG